MNELTLDHARRIGGLFALAFACFGLLISLLFWDFSMIYHSYYHLVAVGLVYPFFAYQLGALVGQRVLIEGEPPVLQGVAWAMMCLFIGMFALFSAEFVYLHLEGAYGNSLDWDMAMWIVRKLLVGTIPAAPLGAMFGACLGLH